MPTQSGEQIGTATMDDNGELIVTLRSVECDGTIAHGQLRYRPGTPGYADMIAHTGAMEPGDTRPVLSGPLDPCPPYSPPRSSP